jgi:hypothetical protein
VIFAVGAQVNIEPSHSYGYGGKQEVPEMGIGRALDSFARSSSC